MRRAKTSRRSLPFGVRALIFRKRWVRSRAVKPSMKSGHRSNTLAVLILLWVAGVLGGCHQEPQIPSQSPRAVRLATAVPQTSGETLRYSASILPYAQVELEFRTSGYVTGVRQVRGADGRTRNIGTGDYVDKGTILAPIRLEDMKHHATQPTPQPDQPVAPAPQADQA